MDLGRPFYDSNIEALRLNPASGAYDKVRLGDLKVGDQVMTADVRGGVRPARVAKAETFRQPTKWLHADVDGYGQLNPTGTTGKFATLADGIAVGTNSHLLNAHPEPVTRNLHDGAKSAGQLDIVGGKRAMVVNGDGCVTARSLKFFVCAGILETRSRDKIAMYERALSRLCRPLGEQYKVIVRRGGGPRLFVQYGNENPVSVPIGANSNVELNGVPVRVQCPDGTYNYIRSAEALDDALANFAREHGAVASWRTLGDLETELASIRERASAVSLDDVTSDPAWEEKRYIKHIAVDRLAYTPDEARVSYAFPLAQMKRDEDEDDKEDAMVDLDAWCSGFWCGDGFANHSSFAVGLPEEGAQGVPNVAEMPAYISERKFDADEQTWEHVKILRNLARFCDAHDAELILQLDERRTQAKQGIQVRLRRRGEYQGAASIMREIFRRYGIESIYGAKTISADVFVKLLSFSSRQSMSFVSGLIDADGSGPQPLWSFFGTNLVQSLDGGHKNIALVFAFLCAQNAFDVRLGMLIAEKQPPAYFRTAEARRADNERRARMSTGEKVNDYRERFGIRFMTSVSVVIQGPRMHALPLAVETKRDADRDLLFTAIDLLAFTCVDGGIRETTFIELDGAYNIVSAHGFALGVGNDFSPIKLDA